MAGYFSIWIRIFLALAMIAVVAYFVWTKFRTKEEKRKKSTYSLKQMKEIR